MPNATTCYTYRQSYQLPGASIYQYTQKYAQKGDGGYGALTDMIATSLSYTRFSNYISSIVAASTVVAS